MTTFLILKGESNWNSDSRFAWLRVSLYASRTIQILLLASVAQSLSYCNKATYLPKIVASFTSTSTSTCYYEHTYTLMEALPKQNYSSFKQTHVETRPPPQKTRRHTPHVRPPLLRTINYTKATRAYRYVSFRISNSNKQAIGANSQPTCLVL